MDWKKFFRGAAKIGVQSAKEILRVKFPISIQVAEYLIGSGKGDQRIAHVVEDGLSLLKAKKAAGELAGEIPTFEEAKQLAQEVFDEMVASGALQEAATFQIGGKTYKIVAVD